MKEFKKALVLVLVIKLLGSCLMSFGQVPNLKFEHISSNEGLPQNTISGIVTDKYGFMWFGTLNGLCRYDGYRFTIYRFDPANNKSINSNQIENVIKDAKGEIWIATQLAYEVCRYDYTTDNFHRIRSENISQELLNKLSRSKYGKQVRYSFGPYVWKLENYTSLVQIDTRLNTKKNYYTNPSNPWALRDQNISSLYKDVQDILWVGTYNMGISKANLKAKPFEYYYHIPLNSLSIVDNVVTAVTRDNKGNLWIGTYDKGITIIGPKGTRHLSFGKTDEIGLSFNQILAILCDSRGDTWIGSRKGLLCYNGRTGQIRGFDDVNKYNHSVYSLMEDSERNIWAATRRDGIYKYIASRNILTSYSHRTTLNTRDARVVIQDRRGLIWVGTEHGGISVLKPVKDTVRLVKRFLSGAAKDSNELSDNHIYCLFEDRDGFIWIGTGNGLDRYSPQKNEFVHFFKNSDLSGILVSAITEDKQANLWISHKMGITRLNRKNGHFRTYSVHDGLQSNEFSERAVYRNISDNTLYFGSSNGLNVFNPDNIKPDSILPRTVLTQLQVLGREVRVNQKINNRIILKRPLYLTEKLELTHEDKSISIEFAGLHYANPNGNRYAYKLLGFDQNWIETDASRRFATYSNLDPGSYTFLVKSSNSDGVWNEKPVQLQIVVHPPFWASIAAYIFYLLVTGGLVYAYHCYSARYNRLKNEILLKSKEQELERQKLQFFTNISHEIKTPLTLILAPLEKLPTLASNKTALAQQVGIMKTNAERLLRTINQLLDFRRLESGNISLDLRTHDLVDFLKHMAASFEPLLNERRLKISFRHKPEEFFFVFDEDKLEKVISNLLSNAIKFSTVGSLVELVLAAEHHNEPIRIDVSNVGKGIPEAEQELIFEPFKQGKASIHGGTGLGLAYSKQLVEQHQGTINVICKAIDSGFFKTTFSVCLPGDLLPDKEAWDTGSLHLGDKHVNYPSNENPILINGKAPLILIVDDNLDLRNYLMQHFESDYRVMKATNGKQGLKLAEENSPDLIISDVMMPEMDGKEFCRHIKTNVNTAHIPLILLTAKTPIESEIEGYETGADDYIIKPFNISHLSVRVRNLLLSRLQLKEKYRSKISLEPSANTPVSADERLLQNFLKYVEERISDPELNVDEICKDVGISRSQLYRRLKTLTGLNVADLIKEIRLKRAKQLLKDNKFNVSEVAYMVGFANPDHFRRSFKQEFGMTPSESQGRSRRI